MMVALQPLAVQPSLNRALTNTKKGMVRLRDVLQCVSPNGGPKKRSEVVWMRRTSAFNVK